MALRILKFVLSAISAQLIAALCLKLFPTTLETSAELIGYPIFANFNINRLFEWYYVQGLLFPALTLLFYLVWTRGKSEPVLPSPKLTPSPDRYTPLWNFLKVAVTGLMLSVATLSFRVMPGSFLSQAIFFAGLYTLAIYLLSRVTKKSTSWLNLMVLPFAWFALAGVSSVTGVFEAGVFRPYPWFPGSLALLLSLGTGAYLWPRVRKLTNPRALESLETESVFLLIVPLFVFLSQSHLPRPQRFELFHDGEHLVPGLLLSKGYFPWRDLLFSHGLLQDPFQSLLGHALFGESFWAVMAGLHLIYMPLYWVASYYLGYALFREKRLFLVALFLILPFSLPGFFGHTHFRFLLWPFVLLLFLRLVKFPTRKVASLFCSLLFVQAIITPESAYAVIASLLAVVVFDLFHRDWRRTLWVGVTGFVCLTAWMAFLYANGAHVGFLEYYRIFAPHHHLTGGIPFKDWPGIYQIAVYTPVLLSVFCFWFFSLKFYRRQDPSPTEWTIFLIYVFSLFYYQKFLSRADSHIYAVYAMGYPILFWVLDKLFQSFDGLLARVPRVARLQALTTPRLTSSLVIFTLCLAFSPHWLEKISGLRENFQARVSGPPKWKRLGYFEAAPAAKQFLEEWEKFLAVNLGPEEKIFDFTNSPGLYYYLLDRRPSTRFFHISMAIRRTAQKLLIDELEREKPRLIVFHGQSELATWDGISNMVRHFEVSRYLLGAYEPFAKIGDTLIFSRKSGASPSASKLAMYFETEPCQWGHTPHFFRNWSQLREGEAQTLAFSTKPDEGGFVTDIQLPKAVARYSALEIEFESLQKDSFYLAASDRANRDPKNYITFHSLPSSRTTYRIPVGSCSQWHGYRADVLKMNHTFPQKISSIKLVK